MKILKKLFLHWKNRCKNYWPEADFKKIDSNKGGAILFEEICNYAIKKNLNLEDDDDFDDCELPIFKK